MNGAHAATAGGCPDQGTDRGFLRRLTAATGGGMFLDGWVYAAIAACIAGTGIIHDLDLSNTGKGLVSASTLIGTLIGGLAIGYLTDITGRKPMFIVDLCTFLVAALLMLVVDSFWLLIVMELALGIAIGGDYAIGSPLLGEFLRKKQRGNYLGILEILWNVGYVISYAVGFLILLADPGAWNYVLATAAVPAAVILLLRHGLPESPRWLLSKGRDEEAQQVLDDVGEGQDTSDYSKEVREQTRWRTLFHRDYLSRTIFACVFWICIVLPYFGLTFFQAEVLGTIGLASPIVAAIIGTIIALCGAAIGWLLVDRVGRRPLLIIPMFATTIFLAIVAVHRVIGLPTMVAVLCFFGYLLFYGVMSILPGIYPIEVFPTSVRTSGEGVASAASRAGAVAGTFILPISIASFGLPVTLGGLSVVCLIGGVTSLFLAPETAGKSLTETGSRQGTDQSMVSHQEA